MNRDPASKPREARPPRGATFSLALALATLGSVITPTTAVAQTTTVAPSGASASAASSPRCASREDCLVEALPLLARTLPRAAAAPAEVAVELMAAQSLAARAWAAYLQHHIGDDAAAERTLATLAAEGEQPRLAPDGASVATRALHLVREHVEALSGRGDDPVAMLPCAVFAWDPEAARDAFAPVHGSSRDAIVAPFKSRCVAESHAALLDVGGRARAQLAEEALLRALFRQWPAPDGTYWNAAAIAARETVRDTLLLLPPRAEVASEAAARALVARLGERDLARLMAYRRAAEGQLGALTTAVCAAVRARGEAITRTRCEDRVRQATLAAFTSWVGALRQR